MRKLASACSVPGCPNITTSSRCAIHQAPRPKTAPRYGRSWQRLRRQVLMDQPFCACGAPATEVDHLVSLGRGGTNDRANLLARCKRCHSWKTAKFDGRWGGP